ncbi:hypothetical protein BDV11DRAFT_202700 [Aspergillus similis]
MAGKLWWMSKQDSGNISPLHRQTVKNRRIIVTEDPGLHMIWIDDRIFLKPLLHYLTSYTFWHEISGTYLHLIQHESDLRIAQDPTLCLVPMEVTWAQFCNFLADLSCVTDDDVSGRYYYRESRLTRLNYYAPVLLGRTHYQRVDYQYRAYFARIQGPPLSAFAFFAILLNCMQVYLATATSDERYMVPKVLDGCYWASILIGTVTEWRFAIRSQIKRRKEQQKNISEEQCL